MKWVAPVCCVLAALISLASAEGGKPFSCDKKFLDNDYELHWEISGDEEDISFRVKAKTKGWIGLGLNNKDTTTMQSADIWIFGRETPTNGVERTYINDYYGPSSGNGKPTVDTESTEKIRELPKSTTRQDGDYTTVTVTRKVKVNTENDDGLHRHSRNIVKGEITLLGAIGPSTGDDVDDPEVGHGNTDPKTRFAVQLDLFKCDGTSGGGGEEGEDDDDAASSVLPFTAMIALLSAALLLVAQRY